MNTFSIIVPVYQAGKYLDRLVCGILEQTCDDYELILVNDGSTDGSGALCDRYSAGNAKIRTIHKMNGGVSSARNAGIEASNGKYLIFLDADDFIEKNYLHGIASRLEKIEADLIVCGYYVHNRKSAVTVLPECKGLFDRQRLAEHFALFADTTSFNSVWNKVFRADLVKRHRIMFKRQKIAEDGAFVCDCLMHADTVLFVDEAFYHYVQNDSSAVHRFCESRWEDELCYLSAFCRLMESYAVPNANVILGHKNQNAILYDLYNLVASPMSTNRCAQILRQHLNELYHRIPWQAQEGALSKKVQLFLLKKRWTGLAIWLLRTKKSLKR